MLDPNPGQGRIFLQLKEPFFIQMTFMAIAWFLLLFRSLKRIHDGQLPDPLFALKIFRVEDVTF